MLFQARRYEDIGIYAIIRQLYSNSRVVVGIVLMLCQGLQKAIKINWILCIFSKFSINTSILMHGIVLTWASA
jgi:hypothetical protein